MDPSGNKFVSSIWNEYSQHVPRNLMVIDAYLTCVFFTGVIQFIYCLIIGNFPFNAFLSGFISCVGTFVLTGKKSIMCHLRLMSLDKLNLDLNSHCVLYVNISFDA